MQNGKPYLNQIVGANNLKILDDVQLKVWDEVEENLGQRIKLRTWLTEQERKEKQWGGGDTISALHLPSPKRKGGELKCNQTGLKRGLVIVKGS